MRRLTLEPRAGWKLKADRVGFTWHHADGRLYWDESAAYALSLREVEEDLEPAARDVHALCLELVGEAVGDERLLRRLSIPEAAWDLVASSWRNREPSLYGRFDFHYAGDGPPKLYEYNADTPTSVYEAAVFQWLWLEELIATGRLPAGADQFNSLFERLRDRFAQIFPQGGFVHFASLPDHVEDRHTVLFLEDVASQAGVEPRFVALEDIGLTTAGRFVDGDGFLIGALFKLHPWEEMLREPFAAAIPASRTLFLEPPWKALLSNKGILPLLWARHPGHPNLLESYFDDDDRAAALGESYVRKPLFSREGANVELVSRGRVDVALDQGYGGEGWIRQARLEPPDFDGQRPVTGIWMVGDEPAGAGFREDRGPVTRDTSRFIPHVIDPEAD